MISNGFDYNYDHAYIWFSYIYIYNYKWFRMVLTTLVIKSIRGLLLIMVDTSYLRIMVLFWICKLLWEFGFLR